MIERRERHDGDVDAQSGIGGQGLPTEGSGRAETISGLLRSHSFHEHRSLEARLDFFNPQFSLEQYRNILALFYGYYAPIEELLSKLVLRDGLVADYEERKKTPLLRQDLGALGIQATHEILLCDRLPRLKNASEVFGCLYVLEGATLGGQVLSKHFRERFGLQPDRGGAFFWSYGLATGARWSSFQRMLHEHHRRHQTETNIVLDAAAETFRTMREWIEGRSRL